MHSESAPLEGRMTMERCLAPCPMVLPLAFGTEEDTRAEANHNSAQDWTLTRATRNDSVRNADLSSASQIATKTFRHVFWCKIG